MVSTTTTAGAFCGLRTRTVSVTAGPLTIFTGSIVTVGGDASGWWIASSSRGLLVRSM